MKRSANLGERGHVLAGGGRLDEGFEQLHVQRDVPLIFGVPLHAGDPPGLILSLEGLDQSIWRQGRDPENRRELTNALVMIAVDPDLARAVNVLEPAARLHHDGVPVGSPVRVTMGDRLGHILGEMNE